MSGSGTKPVGAADPLQLRAPDGDSVGNSIEQKRDESGATAKKQAVPGDSSAQLPPVNLDLNPAVSPALTLAPPRPGGRTLNLALANPLTDADANTSLSVVATTAMSVALDRFGRRFPELDQNGAYRLLEWATTGLLEVEKAVYLHEAGHAREVSRYGGDPEISMGLGSGFTRFNFPAGKHPDALGYADVSGAGTTQVSLNARGQYLQWALTGEAYYQEAAAYLFESLHMALYAGRTLMRGQEAPAWDDIRAYVDDMNRAGASLTTAQVFAVSLATALANAPTLWSATRGQWDFLAHGQRGGITIPSLRLGSVTVPWPHFYAALTGHAGVLAGMTAVAVPDHGTPVSLDLLARVDDWSATAAKLTFHDIPLAQLEGDVRLTASPFFGGTIDRQRGFGGVIGAEVAATRGNARLGVSVAYHDQDLFAAPRGAQGNGLTFMVTIGFRF
jgi:hypothetical protein